MFYSPSKIPDTLTLSEFAHYEPLMFPGQSHASRIQRPSVARKAAGSIPLRRTRSAFLAGAALTCALLIAGPAVAHGFGQRYSLPIPLWLYLTGAGLTVAASFALIALLVRGAPPAQDYKRIDLMRLPIGRVLGAPVVLLGLRLLGVGLYLLSILSMRCSPPPSPFAGGCDPDNRLRSGCATRNRWVPGRRLRCSSRSTSVFAG